MTNQIIELKPCPFCGSKAKLCSSEQHVGDWTIICQDQNNKCNVRMRYFNSKQEVAEQWNRRTLIIDLPGVKKLIEAAYRAGYQEVLDLVKPSFSLYRDIKDYEDNYVYEYMKALEAKDE